MNAHHITPDVTEARHQNQTFDDKRYLSAYSVQLRINLISDKKPLVFPIKELGRRTITVMKSKQLLSPETITNSISLKLK